MFVGAALVALLVTGIIAQAPPPGMMGGGDMMGMMMGPGGAGMGGGGGGGGAISWQPTEAPEHLLMTYDEFLAEEGVPGVSLPDAYLYDDAGADKRQTSIEWEQLSRIYAEGVSVDVERGSPGGPLADRVQAELEHIEKELLAVGELYEYAVNNCFSATIGEPQLGVVGADASSVDVRLNLIIHSSKSFPDRVVKRLKPLSKEGHPWRQGPPATRIGATAGRVRFDVVTKAGGYMQPVKLYLSNEAVDEWSALWQDTQISLSLLDTAGKTIAESTQSPNFDGRICETMIFPPYAWSHRAVHQMPDVSPYGTDLKLFDGGSKSLYEIKGWIIGGEGGVSFNLPTGQLATLNGAQVDLLPAIASGLSDVTLKSVTR